MTHNITINFASINTILNTINIRLDEYEPIHDFGKICVKKIIPKIKPLIIEINTIFNNVNKIHKNEIDTINNDIINTIFFSNFDIDKLIKKLKLKKIPEQSCAVKNNNNKLINISISILLDALIRRIRFWEELLRNNGWDGCHYTCENIIQKSFELFLEKLPKPNEKIFSSIQRNNNNNNTTIKLVHKIEPIVTEIENIIKYALNYSNIKENNKTNIKKKIRRIFQNTNK